MDPFYAPVNSGARPSPHDFVYGRMRRLTDIIYHNNIFILWLIDWCHLVRGKKGVFAFPFGISGTVSTWPGACDYIHSLSRRNP
jgi:hypothetical protein